MLKTILEELVSNALNCEFHPNKCIAHAQSEIIEKCVPEEKKMPEHYDLCLLSNEERASEEGEINGWNACREEMIRRMG